MENELRELKRALDKLPRRGPRRRRDFPSELRVAVLVLVDRAVSSGRTIGGTAKALGLSLTTLSTWLSRRRSNSTPRLRPVHVTTPLPMPRELVLVTPRGYRVEGLTPTELVSVLEELA